MRKYLLISVLIFLIICISLGYIFSAQLLSKFNSFKESISEKSTADLSVKGEKIYIKFKISKKDEKNAALFAKDLRITNLFDGISFELDQNSTLEVSQFLPATLMLRFNENNLDFANEQAISLQSFLSGQKYEISTSSAKATFILNSDRDFSLEAKDPKSILDFATASGKLHLSKKLEDLFPILSKVAKIYLKVNGKHIEGEISLK